MVKKKWVVIGIATVASAALVGNVIVRYPFPQGTKYVTSYDGQTAGTIYQCAHPIEVSVWGAMWPRNSGVIETPVNQNEADQFCKKTIYLRTEEEGEETVMARPEVAKILAEYPHKEVTVSALKFELIKDPNFMGRLLPAYKGRDIGCIIIVASPEGKSVYLEDEGLQTFEEMDYVAFDNYLAAVSAVDKQTFLENLH